MKNEMEDGILLGTFTYDEYGEPTQTFELPVSPTYFMDDFFYTPDFQFSYSVLTIFFSLACRFQLQQLQQPSDAVHRFVELRVLSNWGHMEYTCLYRFRVHGHISNWTKSETPFFARRIFF